MMSKQYNINNIIVILIITHFAVVLFNWFSLTNLKEQIKQDAHVINMLGQIRGSIQMASKLVIANHPASESVSLIEKNFLKLPGMIKPLFSQKSIEAFNELYDGWSELKHSFSIYDHSKGSTQQLLEQSNHLWKVADSVVLQFESDARQKLDKIENIYIIFLLSLCW